MINIESTDFEEAIKKVISKGDHVLVHCSLIHMGNFIDGPNSIIKSLIEAVGNSGTIIMMSHTFSFSRFVTP